MQPTVQYMKQLEAMRMQVHTLHDGFLHRVHALVTHLHDVHRGINDGGIDALHMQHGTAVWTVDLTVGSTNSAVMKKTQMMPKVPMT